MQIEHITKYWVIKKNHSNLIMTFKIIPNIPKLIASSSKNNKNFYNGNKNNM
jgi:hypothetical protein